MSKIKHLTCKGANTLTYSICSRGHDDRHRIGNFEFLMNYNVGLWVRRTQSCINTWEIRVLYCGQDIGIFKVDWENPEKYGRPFTVAGKVHYEHVYQFNRFPNGISLKVEAEQQLNMMIELFNTMPNDKKHV